MPQYAGVYILDLPFALDRIFDYYIPGELREKVRVGGFVTVPFGGGNRRTLAVIVNLTEETLLEGEKVKPIASVCPEELYLNDGMLGLALYMKEQTLCTFGEAVHAMIPAAAFTRLIEYYRATDKTGMPKTKDEGLLTVLRYIREKELVSESTIRGSFGTGSRVFLDKLSSGGWITRELAVRGGMKQ